MYIHTTPYLHIYIHISCALSASPLNAGTKQVYIYICMYICIYIYIYR